jgi:Uma2 family endonuclease
MPAGFEADATYYLNAATRLKDPWDIDITVDSPPDLVVEVDRTNASDTKLSSTYATLGVPEVWHYTQRTGLVASAFVDGAYQRLEISSVIRSLRLEEVARRLRDVKPGDTAAFMTEWREWARSNQPG